MADRYRSTKDNNVQSLFHSLDHYAKIKPTVMDVRHGSLLRSCRVLHEQFGLDLLIPTYYREPALASTGI